MTTYRRGFKAGVWDMVWHWIEQCEDFPRGTCVMQRDRPIEVALCARCKSLSHNQPGR